MSMADYPFLDNATLQLAAKLKETINEVMGKSGGQAMSIQEKKAAIHGPLYGCEMEFCREEQTFPPYSLFWVDAFETEHGEKYAAGWYCNFCPDGTLDPEEFRSRMGQSLADFLESQQ